VLELLNGLRKQLRCWNTELFVLPLASEQWTTHRAQVRVAVIHERLGDALQETVHHTKVNEELCSRWLQLKFGYELGPHDGVCGEP